MFYRCNFTVCEIFLVSTVVIVQYNIDRGQTKSVRTIFIRNLEIIDSILFSGGQSVLL